MSIIPLHNFVIDIDKSYMACFNQSLHPRRSVELFNTYSAELHAFEYLKNGYLKKKEGKVFSEKGQKSVVFFYISAIKRYLDNYGISESATCKFNKDTKVIEIKEEIIYVIIGMLCRDVVGLKVPKYLKNKNKYDKYLKKIKYISTYKKMFADYEKKKFVRNQVEALKLSKTMSVQEVIDFCQKTNKGEFLKNFVDVKRFDKSAEKLYNISIGHLNNKLIKKGIYGATKEMIQKKRLSKKSAVRYLKYLALMSTISTRVSRAIEINSCRELEVFKAAYSFYKNAAIECKWLVVEDSTYCIGVRSRSYLVRVLANKNVVSSKEIVLNNIETEFYLYRNSLKQQGWTQMRLDNPVSIDFVYERIAAMEVQQTYTGQLQLFKKSLMRYKSGNSGGYQTVALAKEKLRSSRWGIKKTVDEYVDKYNKGSHLKMPSFAA